MEVIKRLNDKELESLNRGLLVIVDMLAEIRRAIYHITDQAGGRTDKVRFRIIGQENSRVKTHLIAEFVGDSLQLFDGVKVKYITKDYLTSGGVIVCVETPVRLGSQSSTLSIYPSPVVQQVAKPLAEEDVPPRCSCSECSKVKKI